VAAGGRPSGSWILVADDEAATRDVVRESFARLGYTTQEVTDGREAVAALEGQEPSLVISKVELDAVSGFELCREVREAFGDAVPVILLSAERTEPLDRVAGLLVGADDYLAKPFDPDELLARTRRLLGPAVSDEAESPLSRLTPREREVLELLLGGLTQEQIAERLVISPKTVGTHIQNILTKLGVHSRAQAVALAHRGGLVPSRSPSNS
jgi:DNA-binding NarL/FixJ family response regulator